MIPLSIILDGDNVWPDLKELPEGQLLHSKGINGVALLDHGMSSGRPSVAVRVDLPNGSVVIAETSARLFCTAAKAFMARYPDLFEDGSTVQ